MSESWPSRHEPPPPALPRVEELPIVTEGYDRQKVREAFDAFYRHAAQLDAALRTLEAVDAFQRSAAELRGDLRAIRAAGFAAQTWQRPYAPEPRLRRALLPEAFARVGVEVVFLIAVAVALGVSGWGALPVIGVMGLALTIVWAVEWLASRERPARPVVRRAAVRPTPPAVESPEPGEPPAAGWAAYAERDDERADAMTIVEPLPGTEPVSELEASDDEDEREVVEVVAAAVVVSEPEPDVEMEAEQVEVEVVPEAEAIEEGRHALEEASDVEPPAIAELEPEKVEAESNVAALAEPQLDAPEEREAEPTPAEQAEPQLDAPEEHGPVEPLEVDAREPEELAEADWERPFSREELAEEPAPEASRGDAVPGDEVAAEPELAPRPSFWQRMRGRGSAPDPVLVEPPHGALTDEDADVPDEELDGPALRVDEVGVLEGDESAPAARLDELGIVESSDTASPPPEAVAESVSDEFGDDRPAGRSFWRRRRQPEPSAVADAEPSEPVAEDEQLPAGEAPIDPWEQGLELPVEPELEPILAEQELDHDDAVGIDTDPSAEHEPLVLAEDEPLVRAATEVEDEQLDGGEAEREDEALAVAAEREDDESPILAEADVDGDGAEAVAVEAAEPKELPIEVLAEQAAAALARSRARRRHLRRARRR